MLAKGSKLKAPIGTRMKTVYVIMGEPPQGVFAHLLPEEGRVYKARFCPEFQWHQSSFVDVPVYDVLEKRVKRICLRSSTAERSNRREYIEVTERDYYRWRHNHAIKKTRIPRSI